MPTETYPVCLNPDRYTWDFWYNYDSEKKLFHLIYLNAGRELVPDGKHHGAARLGYATTRDFITVNWINNDVFTADLDGWDNTSIWSGDMLKTASGYVLFYTSRDKDEQDGMTQQIGMAVSKDLLHWERVHSFRLLADPRWYDQNSRIGETIIHAWRDPFLFIQDGVPHMLVAASSSHQPAGRQGAVALLRSKDGGLLNWEQLGPIVDPGWYAEMEVPQLMLGAQGEKWILFSGWAKNDDSPFTSHLGGFQALKLSGKPNDPDMEVKVLLPETAGLYACRVIPELGSEIVGFDIEQGGIRRSGVKVPMVSAARDFSKISLKPVQRVPNPVEHRPGPT